MFYSVVGGTLKKTWNAQCPFFQRTTWAVAKEFYVIGLDFRVTFEASENGRSELLGLERGNITIDAGLSDEGSWSRRMCSAPCG